MKAVRVHQFGEPADVVRVEELPDPAPGRGEVLVRLTARAIHPSDLMNIRGLYGKPPPLPLTPGNDAAGVIEAVGEGVSGPGVGDRVTLLLGAAAGKGTWAERIAVPAALVVPTPAQLSDAQAGALWVNYLSVWVMAVEVLKLGAGDTLLQTAAGSQLGRAMIELARARGFGLINVVRRREQVDELRALGAAHVLCSADEDVPGRARELTGGRGVTAAIDPVGGRTGALAIASLKNDGTALLFGALAREPVPVDPGLLLFRELTVRGFWLTRWLGKTPPERVRAAVGSVLGLVESGDFTPAVDRTYPLAEVAAAARHAEAPGRRGAVVLLDEPIAT